MNVNSLYTLVIISPRRHVLATFMLAYFYQRHILRSRIRRPRRTIDTFGEGDFYIFFIFTKVDFSKLLILFRFPDHVKGEFRYQVSGEECFLILLHRLSYHSHYTAMRSMLGRSKSALSSIFNFALDFVYGKCKHLLSFDWERLTPSYLDEMCALNTAKGSILENCVGFIDDTVRPICRPGERQRLYYNGHRCIHALKYQSIVFPDGIIVFADSPYSGNRHDAGLFRDGGLEEILGERLKRTRWLSALFVRCSLSSKVIIHR
jgi:hypothetical protein